jgi:N-terminal domain of reverse transcriptase
MEGKAVSHRNATQALTVEAEATLPLPPSEDWAQIPWRKLEQYVYRLQKRIYRASAPEVVLTMTHRHEERLDGKLSRAVLKAGRREQSLLPSHHMVWHA